MPPRIPVRTTTVASPLGFLSDSLSSLSLYSSSLLSATSSSASSASPLPTSRTRQPCSVSVTATRSFSATPAARARRPSKRDKMMMYSWFKNQGARYKELRCENYLGKDVPFPRNPFFKSLPVLSEDAREMIWEKVMRQGESVKAVSVELGVDIRRVAAVVRLKEVEKSWVETGKRLAIPYSRTILNLLPTHDYDLKSGPLRPLEPINEVPVHPYTQQQIWVPVSESRRFTRADAAKAFHEHLLPTDARIPHPEYVQMERDIRVRGDAPAEARERFREAAALSETCVAQRNRRAAEDEERVTTRVRGARAEFRFRDVNVDSSGPHGRSLKGVGWRYGVGLYDRKKGEVKIPTKVE